MAGEKILIVDDNEANLKLLKFLLSSAGYVVDVAMDAPQALQVLARFKPQMILMDIQLPGVNGLDLTRQIKENPDTAAITIVAVTAYAMKGDEEKARLAGCDGYITKPLNTRTIATTVAELLEGRRG